MLIHQHIEAVLPKRLVVLGGSGFVGRHIVTLAKSLGIEILSLASREVNLCVADAGEKLAKILAPEDSVVFCAAIDKGNRSGSEDVIKNIMMARSIVDVAARMPFSHLAYLSSESVYPYEPGLLSEAAQAAPATLYGAMHRTREMILAAETTLPLAVLRLTGIYGGGDTHNAYGPNRFMRQAVQEGKITLFGNGEEMRDHLYIEDAAALIIQVVCHRSTGTLNLATGHSLSFHAVAQRVAAHTGARIETAPRRRPITHRHFDIARRLNAFPSFVPMAMEQALAQMLDKHKYSVMQEA